MRKLVCYIESFILFRLSLTFSKILEYLFMFQWSAAEILNLVYGCIIIAKGKIVIALRVWLRNRRKTEKIGSS